MPIYYDFIKMKKFTIYYNYKLFSKLGGKVACKFHLSIIGSNLYDNYKGQYAIQKL